MKSLLPVMQPVFNQYEELCREADSLFTSVAQLHPDCVSCATGCSDCCNALFDLPLIEAVYLNYVFTSKFPHGARRSEILERANSADRALQRIKRLAFKAEQEGASPQFILDEIARHKVSCPLLTPPDAQGRQRCELYAQRPITCRIYGIPTAISGKAYSCGLSHFQSGSPYPTVDMGAMHLRLSRLSQKLSACIDAGFAELHAVYVPVSSALLTAYDASYFGLDKKRKVQE